MSQDKISRRKVAQLVWISCFLSEAHAINTDPRGLPVFQWLLPLATVICNLIHIFTRPTPLSNSFSFTVHVSHPKSQSPWRPKRSYSVNPHYNSKWCIGRRPTFLSNFFFALSAILKFPLYPLPFSSIQYFKAATDTFFGVRYLVVGILNKLLNTLNATSSIICPLFSWWDTHIERVGFFFNQFSTIELSCQSLQIYVGRVSRRL